MILADTHTHLYLENFDADRDEVIKNALDTGVQYMLLPNIDRDSIPSMLSLAKSYPGHCIPMMGLHPTSVKQDYKEHMAEVEMWLSRRSFCAVGETGIDLYWDKTYQKEQETAFREQIRLAMQYDLPVVIHSRNSFGEILNVLKEERNDRLRGVFHCFSGSLEDAREVIGMGFKLGIGGVLTYKNSGLYFVMENIDLKHIILETDSPFLPPVPHRGKRNESAWVLFVAQKLALAKGVSVEEIAEITTQNARDLFKLV
jgi:TatD DNase family protein